MTTEDVVRCVDGGICDFRNDVFLAHTYIARVSILDPARKSLQCGIRRNFEQIET